MKSPKINRIMAVYLCLFSFSLCAYPVDNRFIENNYNNINYQPQNYGGNMYDYRRAGSLSAQTVSVPTAQSSNVSPCPKVFRYLFDGEDWEGRVRVDKPAPRGLPSYLRVEMSIGFRYNSVSFNNMNFFLCHHENIFRNL